MNEPNQLPPPPSLVDIEDAHPLDKAIFACYPASERAVYWLVDLRYSATMTQAFADDMVNTFRDALQMFVRKRG